MMFLIPKAFLVAAVVLTASHAATVDSPLISISLGMLANESTSQMGAEQKEGGTHNSYEVPASGLTLEEIASIQTAESETVTSLQTRKPLTVISSQTEQPLIATIPQTGQPITVTSSHNEQPVTETSSETDTNTVTLQAASEVTDVFATVTGASVTNTKELQKNIPALSNEGIDKTYYETANMQPQDVVTSVVSEGGDSHPCARECIEGTPPMRCQFRFELEWYYTMSKACYDCPRNADDCNRMHCIPADGIMRPVIVINRQMPGPSVEVCKGDTIIVDVVNMMLEETSTIHWHGHHQRGTPYMDGVPYVTQCPIPPKNTFRYRFRADTPGTHFWHSHSGCQRGDGVYGALIVRVPRSQDPHSKLYDFDLSEHTIHVTDWGPQLSIDKFLAHYHSNGTNKPSTLLVNGRGWLKGEDSNGEVPVSPTTFHVVQGHRYRFRVINSGFLNCPIEVSIDNHTLLVISSDGSDIQPIPAVSLVTYAGERFDFILEANQSSANYWFRFRGLMDCGENFTSAHQVAVLHYKNSPVNEHPKAPVSYKMSHRPGMQVNTLNVGPDTELSLVIPELEAIDEYDESLKAEPDMKLYLGYDFYDLDNPHYHRELYYGFHNVTDKNQRRFTPQLNHISMKLQPFSLLSQRELIEPDMLCNHTKLEECRFKYCECTYVVNVPLDSVLEIILVDEGVTFDANHPFHLHGYAFRVVAMGRVGSSTTVDHIKELDDSGFIHRKLRGAPLKDTVTVPDGGYTVLRIHASNPGYWLFHCHLEFHAELGMAIIFKVGDHSDLPQVPKGFPKCNTWAPDDEDDLDFEIDSIKETNVIPHKLEKWSLSSGHRMLASSLMVALMVLCLLH